MAGILFYQSDIIDFLYQKKLSNWGGVKCPRFSVIINACSAHHEVKKELL